MGSLMKLENLLLLMFLGLAYGPFLCIRVNIDIMKPLMCGKMVEKLPIFCYPCGVLGQKGARTS